ncbi:MAG: AraC family transcriptional regulator [Lachnospiraceae bacterium]|nr:AraC family transcriptional regulator [Lachnospiraceae bacterium]
MEKLESVIQALEFIDGNYHEDLNYKTVAENYHISPYYFHRIFTKIVGKTVTEYIREKRLQEAGRFLCDTQRSILDICLDCGFTSPQSFSRIFKSYYGITPRDYRKNVSLPTGEPLEEMIARFRNKTIGGMCMEPEIMEQGRLICCGQTINHFISVFFCERYVRSQYLF